MITEHCSLVGLCARGFGLSAPLFAPGHGGRSGCHLHASWAPAKGPEEAASARAFSWKRRDAGRGWHRHPAACRMVLQAQQSPLPSAPGRVRPALWAPALCHDLRGQPRAAQTCQAGVNEPRAKPVRSLPTQLRVCSQGAERLVVKALQCKGEVHKGGPGAWLCRALLGNTLGAKGNPISLCITGHRQPGRPAGPPRAEGALECSLRAQSGAAPRGDKSTKGCTRHTENHVEAFLSYNKKNPRRKTALCPWSARPGQPGVREAQVAHTHRKGCVTQGAAEAGVGCVSPGPRPPGGACLQPWWQRLLHGQCLSRAAGAFRGAERPCAASLDLGPCPGASRQPHSPAGLRLGSPAWQAGGGPSFSCPLSAHRLPPPARVQLPPKVVPTQRNPTLFSCPL